MSIHNIALGTFETHLQAKEAVLRLKSGGLDLKQVSMIGKDCSGRDRLNQWGKERDFWAGLWGLLYGAGLFRIPDIGRVLVSGALVSTIIDLAEDVAEHDDEYMDKKSPSAAMGSLGIVGKGLRRIGMPEEYITQSEDAVQAGQFVLIFQGEPDEVDQAAEVLDGANIKETAMHEHDRG